MTDEPPFDRHLHRSTRTCSSSTPRARSTCRRRPALLDAVNAVSDAARLVIIDLTQVTFLDSSGLNTLVRAQRQLAPRGIALRIVSPSDRVVRRVFEIAHLEDELTLVETVADARA